MSDDRTVANVNRIESIDILRGITILVMIFVNDVAGVRGTPYWMKHISPPLADGMTFVDIVFPAFLFIVGMAIPFALNRRLDQGQTPSEIWKHVIIRTLSLLIIGVFMVNSESLSAEGYLSPSLWILLLYTGVIAVWNKSANRGMIIRSIGAGLLILAAILYRGEGPEQLIELRPQWWGILGLIGWSYLVGCTVYYIFRPKLHPMVAMMAILYCVYIADETGFFKHFYDIFPWIKIGSALGSHGAVVVSGVILGMVLMPGAANQSPVWRMRWAILYGFGMAAAAILLHSGRELHQMFIINKILATPPWCLWSSAIMTWIWVIVYWLVDVKGWKTWAIIVRPAGANALFAYILAPVVYALFDLFSMLFGGFNFYHWLGQDFAIGFWRSLLFAFGVTWLAGGLRRIGIVLKL